MDLTPQAPAPAAQPGDVDWLKAAPGQSIREQGPVGTPQVQVAPDQGAAAPADTPIARTNAPTIPGQFNNDNAIDPTVAHLHQPDYVDVAEATWHLQTIAGQQATTLGADIDQDLKSTVDPAFNPYTALKDPSFSDVQDLAASGWFASANNPAQLAEMVAVARANRMAQQTIAAGNGGSTAANMLVGLLDYTSLFSAGMSAEAMGAKSLLGRLGQSAVAGGIDATIQTAAIGNTNATQTRDDAFMGIISGVALGVGLGGVFHLLGVHPNDPLHPGNPENPLAPQNLDKVTIHEHAPGQTLDEGTTVSNAQGGSVGAAIVDGASVQRLSADQIDPYLTVAKGSGVSGWLADKISWLGTTPLARLQNYDGPGSAAMFRLYDTMGIVSEAMNRGLSQGVEAETLRTLASQKIQQAQSEVTGIFNAANKSLGGTGAGQKAANVTRIATLGAVDVSKVTQKTFFDAMADKLAGLKTKDPGADSRIMANLQAAGHSPEDAKIIKAHVDHAVNVQTKYYNDTWDHAIKIGAADPRLATDGPYGGPTLFNKKAIDRNPLAFRSHVMEQLADRPSDAWLLAEGHIEDPLNPTKSPIQELVDQRKAQRDTIQRQRDAAPGSQKDGFDTILANHDAATADLTAKMQGENPAADVAAPKPASWADIDKGDIGRKTDILTDWAGSVENSRHDLLEAQHAASLKTMADAQDAAATAASEFSQVSKDTQKLNAKQIAAHAAVVEQGIHVRNLAAASRAADKAEAKVNAILAHYKGDIGELHEDVKAQATADGHALAGHTVAAESAHVGGEDAQSLIDALRSEKQPSIEAQKKAQSDGTWKGSRDQAIHQDHIDKVNAELRDAYAARKSAQDDLRQAKNDMATTARSQKNAEAWSAGITKDAEALAKHDPEGQLAPGLRERLLADQDRLEVVQDHLRDVNAARARAISLKKMMRADLTEANQNLDKSAGQLRRDAFAVQRSANATPLAKYAEELTNHLRGDDRLPGGMLMDNQPTTGRLKERQFDWKPDTYRKLMADGMVETDPLHMLDRYGSDMGGTTALHESFGGKTKSDVMAEIGKHYDDKLAAPGLTDKQKAKITATRRGNLEDVQAGYDRIMGHASNKDDNGVVWGAEKLKHLGLLRYQGGFVLTKMVDLATTALTTPGSAVGMVLGRGFRDFAHIVDMAAKGDKGAQDLLWLHGSLEHGSMVGYSERQFGNGSGRDMVGFGTGLTRQLSGKIDTALNAGSTAIHSMSGMGMLTDGVRRTASFMQVARIRDIVSRFDEATAGEKLDLYKLGIGSSEAKLMNSMFEKYGTTSEKGMFIPNGQNWSASARGDEMSDLLNAAIIKTQKRAALGAGSMGTTPLLADKWYGKLFLQFQSFQQQFGTAFVRAGLQHQALTNDMRFPMALAGSMVAGLATVVIAAYRKGGPDAVANLQKPENWASTVYQIAQRSAVFGFGGSYIDAGVKEFNPLLQRATGLSLDNGGGKFSQNSALANAAGPWFGQLEQASSMLADMTSGNTQDMFRKGRSLIPMNQFFRIGSYLSGHNPDQ